MFKQGMFTIDQNTTPEQLARKRALIEKMMPQYGKARYVGEGLGQLAYGIGAGMKGRKMDKFESGKRDEATKAFEALTGGPMSILGMNEDWGRVQTGVQQPQMNSPEVATNSPFMQAPAPDDMGPHAGMRTDNAGPSNLGDVTAYQNGQDAGANNAQSPRDAFIAEMMPLAIEASRQTGLDPRIIIAQAAQETGWGKSAPGNNFFGIKSHGQEGGQTLATKEFIGGQSQDVQDSFRAYGGMGDSVQGYVDFLKKNPRYSDMLSANGLDAQVAALGQSGYATDPNYAKSVGQIANSIQGIGQPSEAIRPMGGGQQPSMQDLYAAMANPWLLPEQKAQIGAMIQQNDPMRAMEMERAQLELEALRNPKAKPTDDMREYEFAKSQGYEGSFQDFMLENRRAGAPSITNNMGQPVQPLGTDGSILIQDTDSESGYRVEQAAGSEAEREAQAATKAVEQAKAEASDALNLIQSIKGDPNLESITGVLQGNMPAGIPFITGGQDGADLGVKVEQLQGKAFLQAFETLKGGGQITEREGIAAQNAIARLKRVQSYKAYIQALTELESIVKRGLDRAETGEQATSTSDDDLFKKYGVE